MLVFYLFEMAKSCKEVGFYEQILQLFCNIYTVIIRISTN